MINNDLPLPSFAFCSHLTVTMSKCLNLIEVLLVYVCCSISIPYALKVELVSQFNNLIITRDYALSRKHYYISFPLSI